MEKKKFLLLGVQSGHDVDQCSAPVTALDVELLISQSLHQVDHHDGHLRVTEPGLGGRLREPVTGQAGYDEFKVELEVLGVREERDGLLELDEAPGPAVEQQEREYRFL
jgi:hypothetical protein